MSERSDDAEIATAPEHFVRSRLDARPTPAPIGHDDAPASDSGEGLESQILLARARQRLLGWDDTPAHIGRYRVLERIGAGGMGVVYAAHDDELDRVVAIKILRSELAPGTAGRQRLLREAQATARLSHPNVVHVFEVGQQGDHVYMAMELVRGDTLRAWQSKRRWPEIVAMYRDVGEGLVAAHAQSIVHRDFKPDNVLVGHDERPQIVDFGLARASGELEGTEQARPSGSGPAWRDLDITGTGTVLGTPAYMAPEQLRRAKPDARCDQFSFCVALFEALYGLRPFVGTTYAELADSLEAGVTAPVDDRRGVPEAVHAVVRRGLAHEPADRFGSMRELLDALALASKPRAKRARFGLALALAGAATIGAVGWAVAPRGSEPAATAPVELAAPHDDWAEIVAGSELPPLVPTPLPDDPTGVTLHRLANGLTIYLSYQPAEPMVTMILAIRAGATEEGDAHPGLASLVRESVRRGSAKVGTSNAALEAPLIAWQHALIERLPDVRDPDARAHMLQTIAAAEQASSAFEVEDELGQAAIALGGSPAMVLGGHGTVYSSRQPANRVGAWLELVGEVVQRPVFRGFLGSTAQQLEMTGALDIGDPGGSARDPLLAAVTGVHRGGEASFGTLAQVPLLAARRFHHELYRPNNAALVMIGDITAEEAVRIAEQSLGAWEPAALPKVQIVDAPLPDHRTLLEVTAPGGGALELVWAMPPWGTVEHMQLQLLEHVLGGPRGLIAALGGDNAQGYGMHIGETRDFLVIAIPKPGELGDALEPTVMKSLSAIAEGRVSDELWDAALAESGLERLNWARGPSSLASAIAASFLSRQPWARAALGLAVAPPTRAQIMAATRTLLARPLFVTHWRDGAAPVLDAPQLPSLPPLPAPRERSPFVEAIVDTPANEMEPRFLVAGSSYEETAHGGGRVITARAAGPLFWLTWIYPTGGAEDPWACDATRARLPAARIAGVRLSVLCTTADTRVSVMGPAARFAELAPRLSAWLQADTLELDPRYVEFSAHSRVMQRSTSFLRLMSTEAWALLGDNAMDARMPDDAQLRSAAARELPRALAAMQRHDADVLYVGPDPDALRASLPPPRGTTLPGPPLPIYRRPATPEVIVMDDPTHHQVSVRAMLPWIAESPREQLAAQLHQRLAADGEATARFPIDDDHAEYEPRWRRGTPLAIGVGFRVEPDEVVAGLETAIAALRRRPAPDSIDRLHRDLEAEFRAARAIPQHVPELVHAWPEGAVDPRIGQWLALPSLAATDVDAYWAEVDTTIPALVVVGDLRTIDLDALAELGMIVRLDPATVMRDAGQELRRDLSALMNE